MKYGVFRNFFQLHLANLTSYFFPLQIIFTLVCVICQINAAPALSSVHVSFISGNQATQYTHGSGTVDDGSGLQYNIGGKIRLVLRLHLI